MTDLRALMKPRTSRLAGTLLAAAAVLACPNLARAIEYEVFIDIDEEDDLYDLQADGVISDTTFENVLDILRRGTDLNTATREELYALPNLTYDDVDKILAYRDDAGYIADPASLVVAGVMKRRKLASIAPFLLVPKQDGSKVGVRGFVRYQTVWTVRDKRAPPMALQARVSTLRYLTIGGAALLDRNRLAPVSWDPNREALTSEGPRTRPRVPKYFATWDTPNWGVIAGTYGVGFGQRLVFDTSGRYTPNGYYLDDTISRSTDLSSECRLSTGELTETPCPSDEESIYVTPDYRSQERLRGAAIGAKKIPLPVGWLQAYAFVSYQTKSIYQYGIYDASACADPRLNRDDFPECSSPDVILDQGVDPLAPAPELAFATLPNMYNEVVGGANTSYFFDRRTHVGVTGYGATVDWLVDGADLDFAAAERSPFGGPWGAVGADAAWGRRWADLFLEVGHSFDSINPEGGGGPAAILRHTATWDTHEIEASARYYSPEYANPYARPIAAADEFQGQRARDEIGGRIRYNGQIAERLSLRTLLDVWGNETTGIPSLRVFARSDVQALPWLAPGLWAEYQSRNLEASGRDRCYSSGEDDFGNTTTGQGDFVNDQFDQGGDCAGERVQLTGRVRLDPAKRVNVTLTYRHDFTDDSVYENRFRQDSLASLIVGANPVSDLRLRFRVRYDNDDISNNARLEETLWAYAQVGYRVRPWFYPSLRYDLRFWLDQRDSTALRRPDPEHWLYLKIESRF